MAQVRIQHSFDTEENWTAHNPVLREGEMVLAKEAGGNVKLLVGDRVGGVNFNEAPVIWDKTEAESALNTVTMTTAELSGRLDNLEAAGTVTAYYVQCTSTDIGALHVVASGADEGEILLAQVTPHLDGYTPAVGDYVQLAISAVGSELADLRVDVDGVAHASAGAAVRAAMARALRRISVNEEQAASIYGNLLSNLPAMTTTYIDTAWFTDAPQTGYAWVTTYGADSSGAVSLYGYQEIYYVFGNIAYVRRYQEGEWKAWEDRQGAVVRGRGAVADGGDLNGLSVPGVYVLMYGYTYVNAPPVTSGGLLLAFNSTADARTRVQIVYEFIRGDYWYRRGIRCGTEDEEWGEWEYNGDRKNMKRVSVTQEEASSTYGNLLSNLPAMTTTYIDTAWFTDAPQTGYAWVTTYGADSSGAVSLYGYQEIYYVFGNIAYVRRYQEGEWKAWEDRQGAVVRGRGAVADGGDLNGLSVPGVYVLMYGYTYVNAPPVTSGGLLLAFNSTADARTRVQIVYEFIRGDYWYRRGIRCGTEDEEWTEWSHHGQDSLGSGTYLAFGDSITLGTRNSPAGGRTTYTLPAGIAKATGVTAVNKGVGGQGVLKAPSGGVTGYDTLVANAALLPTADLITLSWGINDYSYPLGTTADATTDETICGRWKKIIEYVQATAPNAQLIIMGPMRTAANDWDYTMSGGWSINSLYTAMQTICESYNVPYITWKKCAIANNIGDAANSEDGVHPSDAMYKRLGAYIAGQVSQYFTNMWEL